MSPARRRVPANKGKTFPAETLSGEEARKLLAACRGGPTGARNRALLVLLYRGGLRIGEATTLAADHVDPDTGVVRIRHGKRTRKGRTPGAKRVHHPRTVALDPEATAIVATWIAKRAALDLLASAPLLCTLAGRPLLPSYVRALLPRLGQRAGIGKRVHPHGLRHTYAAELAREGVPMNAIQAALGHRSLATTSTYLAHVAPDELVATLRARTWTPPTR